MSNVLLFTLFCCTKLLKKKGSALKAETNLWPDIVRNYSCEFMFSEGTIMAEIA